MDVIMSSLRGKTVFITGSSIGIGREDAFQFAQEGCSVVITYNTNREEAELVATQCQKLGAVKTSVFPLDVTDDGSIQRCVGLIQETYGDVSILINNAGIIVWNYLAEQSFDDIAKQVRINLEGLIKVTNACLPIVKDCIINMSSAAGLDGYPRLSTYCATKWGVRGFTKAIAEELPNLSVYCVNPGVIATQMNDFRGMQIGRASCRE